MAKRQVDGTKYFHYQQHFIRTGSLRSFDLMMRHYEAAGLMDLPPIPESAGRRRKPCQHYANKVVGFASELSPRPNDVTYTCELAGCKVYYCKVCLQVFIKHKRLPPVRDAALPPAPALEEYDLPF